MASQSGIFWNATASTVSSDGRPEPGSPIATLGAQQALQALQAQQAATVQQAQQQEAVQQQQQLISLQAAWAQQAEQVVSVQAVAARHTQGATEQAQLLQLLQATAAQQAQEEAQQTQVLQLLQAAAAQEAQEEAQEEALTAQLLQVVHVLLQSAAGDTSASPGSSFMTAPAAPLLAPARVAQQAQRGASCVPAVRPAVTTAPQADAQQPFRPAGLPADAARQAARLDALTGTVGPCYRP